MSTQKIPSSTTPSVASTATVKTSAQPPAAATPEPKKSLLQQFQDLEAGRKAKLRSAVGGAVSEAKTAVKGAVNDAATGAGNLFSQARAKIGGDGIVSQNSVNKDGTANTKTSVPLRANADQVNQALMGDWSKWWNHSVVSERSEDGKSFTIKPLGELAGKGPSVGIKLGEPQRATDAEGLTTIKMPMSFTGSFEGRGTVTIQETAPGTSQLTFDWPSIKTNGLPPAVAVTAHTLALEGDTPFFNGTGFEGLKAHLEGAN